MSTISDFPDIVLCLTSRFADFDLVYEFGRIIEQSTGRHAGKDEDRWGYSQASTLKISGRHMIPIWRILKSEVNLTSYTFENLVFHILRRRCVALPGWLISATLTSFVYSTPHYPTENLTTWYSDGIPEHTHRVFSYFLNRVEMDVEMLDEAEVVSRNA